MARYAFAARLARGKRVLDAGCGAGYGSAELAEVGRLRHRHRRRAEAIEYARAHYRGRQSGASSRRPARRCRIVDGAFDLVVAFEVIEHLEDWRAFLREARRVLAPSGQFIVSTPNRLYYAESRGADGRQSRSTCTNSISPNSPRELRQFFPHVSMFLENHVEGVAFQPHEPGNTVEARVDAADAGARREPLLPRGLRPPAADRQPDVRLCAAHRQRAARARAPHRQARRRTGAPRTSGWIRRSSIWPSSTASTRSCWSCSASRRSSWSAATGGRRS